MNWPIIFMSITSARFAGLMAVLGMLNALVELFVPWRWGGVFGWVPAASVWLLLSIRNSE